MVQAEPRLDEVDAKIHPASADHSTARAGARTDTLTWFSPPVETVARSVAAEQSPATWSHSTPTTWSLAEANTKQNTVDGSTGEADRNSRKIRSKFVRFVGSESPAGEKTDRDDRLLLAIDCLRSVRLRLRPTETVLPIDFHLSSAIGRQLDGAGAHARTSRGGGGGGGGGYQL
nr:unnamed protein product [Spirometra erinaceieuropaei]